MFAESVFDFEFPRHNQPTVFSLRSIVHVTTQMRYGQPDAMLGKGELSKHGHGGHYCPEKPFVFWNLLHDQLPGSTTHKPLPDIPGSQLPEQETKETLNKAW